MLNSEYLRGRVATLIAVYDSITDTASKAAVIEFADDFRRWADELDRGPPGKSDGA